MGKLLEKKKRAKRRAFNKTQQQLFTAEQERKDMLEREFHNQRGEPVTVIEIFNIIRDVLDDTNRYRIEEELKRLLIRRAT